MTRFTPCTIALLVLAFGGHEVWGQQSFRRGGAEFNALRSVTVAPGKSYPIVVVEFFHHGELAADGKNLLVCTTRGQQVVPSRILQVGPGDFCRLAFQTAGGQSSYEILYGGEKPAEGTIPPWTCKDGLLLEVREYVPCDLNRLDSVREAFDRAKLIGRDYVDNVFHSSNPLRAEPGPFMSRYTGVLHIDTPANYRLFTSSRDCSFLLVDGKVAVAAPGRHGPTHRAHPGTGAEHRLTPGGHPFEYHHVCVTGDPVMVAAWEIDPKDPKPARPEHIPSENFRAAAVGRVGAEAPLMRLTRLAPDFMVKVQGSVPLPDNEVPLIQVLFKDNSSKALIGKNRVLWDFGDGQKSEEPEPAHVYLRPGIYTVRLSVARPPKPVEIVNRVSIAAPLVTRRDKEPTLDDYLPTVVRYDPRTLDGPSLLQWLAALEAKVAALEARPENAAPVTAPRRRQRRKGEPEPVEPIAQTLDLKEQMAARRAEAAKYVEGLVKIGKAVLLDQTAAENETDLLKFVEELAPIARDRLGQSALAYDLWLAASRRMKSPERKGRCELEAASLAITDLVKPAEAKKLLDAAQSDLGVLRPGPLASLLQRVWGDYYAAIGDGKAARKAYTAAETLFGSTKSYIERTAWRGAHNRSTEEFLKEKQYDRAAAQLRAWEREFPTEKIGGQLTHIYARYWAARKMYDQVAGLCDQLLNVNADSPYADYLLLLAARCEVDRGKTDRAVAVLQSLLKDYPGSPLVPQAKELLAKAQAPAGNTPATGKRRKAP